MILSIVRAHGGRLPPRTRPVLESLARRMAPAWLRVDLVVADDALLRRLNREWRGRDGSTDVLSFLYADTRRRPRWREASDGPDAEVYVSMARVRAQARQRGHALGRELVLLVLHGLLHLQGHDHATPSQARRMRRAERPHLQWLHRRWSWPALEPLVPAAGTGAARTGSVT